MYNINTHILINYYFNILLFYTYQGLVWHKMLCVCQKQVPQEQYVIKDTANK